MEKEDDFINELNFCPTIYHAVSMFREKLLSYGYAELKNDLEWPSPPPSNFFIIFNNKNIIAFNNKDKSKGTFLIGNMKPNLFHIDKSSKIATFDYNFCRVLSSCTKLDHWNGRAMRIAGHITVQDEKSKEINDINIFPKKLAGIFPSKQEIDFIRNSVDLEKTPEQKKLYPIDFFMGLSRDCNFIINDFSGPIMKIISDELEISPCLIQNPDLFFVDSNLSNLIGDSNENNDRIISGPNISQLVPPLLAFNSFLHSSKPENAESKKFNSFILFDENDPTDSSFNEFLFKLFQKIGITNDSLVLNIVPITNEKIESRIFFDTQSKDLEDVFVNEPKYLSSKIQLELKPNLISVVNSISQEVIKLGFPVSNFENPRERTSLNCLNLFKEVIDKIIINS